MFQGRELLKDSARVLVGHAVVGGRKFENYGSVATLLSHISGGMAGNLHLVARKGSGQQSVALSTVPLRSFMMEGERTWKSCA